MSKTLCDWSKDDIRKHPHKLAELIVHAKFFCRRCARAANCHKVLCKPRKIPKQELHG